MEWAIVTIIQCWNGTKWLDACLYQRGAENKAEICQTKERLIITGVTIKKGEGITYECSKDDRK